MRLIDRLRGAESRSISTIDDYASLLGSFNFNGVEFSHGAGSSLSSGPSETVTTSFAGYSSGLYKSGGVVFSIAAVRHLLFAEARFAFQRRENGRPQELFTSGELRILEQPWRGGTTGDLLARMDQDVVLAGNSYITKVGRQLRRLRPDWVDVVIGSDGQDINGIDAEVVGYLYWPGGRGVAKRPTVLTVDEVAHFAPYPDPMKSWVGMSPLQPIVAEVLSHKGAQQHKIKFYDHAATPNLVFTMDPSITPDKLKEFKGLVDGGHMGAANAYKNLFIGGGADVKVVGADFKQLDFKVVQGHSETLIAAALGVHPVIVGLSEGMQGSALNAGNYGQARRRFADGTMRPLWRNAAACLASLIEVPAGAELTYDVRDVSFLQEDAADAAEIFSRKASAARQLTDGGFTPDSVVAALDTLDVKKLTHTGLLSVQMQKPGAQVDAGGGVPTEPEEGTDD